MFRYHPLPSYLLLVIVILATSRRAACQCRQDQSAALLRLKASFRTDDTTSSNCVMTPIYGIILTSWKVGTNCCTWESVTCDGTSGYVTALDLSELCISGNLSSSEIFKLTSLRFLSLAYNNFDANPWPSPGFEQLTDLKYLDLSYSGLSGTLPVENGQLSNLVSLNLSGLDLKDLKLETLIESLGSLQHLHLDYANISVSPTDLSDASSTNITSGLKELSMRGCTSTISSGCFHSVTNLIGTYFFYNNLTGTFPSWIFHIKSMTFLDVSGNDNLRGHLPEFTQGSAFQVLRLSGTKFSGRIPESIRNLRNLTSLELSNCQFQGLIPSFAEWPMIWRVDLSGNNLTGSLPSDGYLSLHNLTYLLLSDNSLSGVIPASLFSHPSLETLDLSQNNFTGNFLLYPNISSSLREIDFSFNKLHGHLPELLSEFVGLVLLDVSSNNLNGTVDISFIKDYRELYYLSLSYNKLSVVEEDSNHSYKGYPVIKELGLASCNLSYLPNFLMHQKNIFELDISNNNIGGHIPDWIWGQDFLSLNLSHNLFTSVNTSLSNSTIIFLDLNSNKIEGALPLPPSGISHLDYSNNHFNYSIKPEFWSRVILANILSLANNSLTGEVSHLICKATDIRVLDLSFNRFSGLIPPCLLKDNKGLEIVNLRANNFNGSLPQGIRKDCALQIIDLNGNKLKGKLPMSMINCRKLQVLDLGSNLIVDTYPEWLGVLPLLKVLVLKSNGFHGPIDYSGMNKQVHAFFPELQVLDLSSNFFNGGIPKRFLKQLKAMMVVSSGAPSMYVGIVETKANGTNYRQSSTLTVTLKGQETTMVQILSVFMYLDLSNNNFDGIVPNEIGDLKLLKQLNLSRNSFTGGIPPHISNMLQLETLDLSFNQLSGEIPPAIAVMSFLEVLNLSYNHLSGMIPRSNQFWTFPNTSFLGNDGLCGKPLARLCETEHGPSAAPTPASSKELNWEFLSVEIGVVSGLAIVVVTTLLWGNGRRWVYWHVDKFWLQVLQPWICHCLR